MNDQHYAEDATTAWRRALTTAIKVGRVVSPRGKKVLEVDHYTSIIDMTRPVMRDPGRKLNYRFMAAEASWILSGSNQLAPLLEVNPKMAAFSDDGLTLAGAYGPRILSQFIYVVEKITSDPDTRQATMTIWTPNPGPSKDIPCTVAMDFKLRDGRLNAHVFMRSSDVWLGLPYDVFAFTSVACTIVAALNRRMSDDEKAAGARVLPGTLFLTAASSHVYEEHVDAARVLLILPPWHDDSRLPDDFLKSPYQYLIGLKETKKGDPLRWWESAS